MDSRNSHHGLLGTYFGSLFNQHLNAKLRKIADALYILTNHIQSDDGLRDKLRSSTLEALSMSLRLREVGGTTNQQESLDALSFHLMSSLSFLEIAVVSGVISPVNYSIVSRELQYVLESVTEKLKDKQQQTPVLNAGFFTSGLKDNQATGRTVTKDTKIKDSVAGPLDPSAIDPDRDNNVSDSLQTPARRQRSGTVTSVHMNGAEQLLRTDEKNRRELSVMSLFSGGGKMTVNDVHELLPHYGPKTIQRELIRLVGAGKLLREGSKRWTRYFAKA